MHFRSRKANKAPGWTEKIPKNWWLLASLKEKNRGGNSPMCWSDQLRPTLDSTVYNAPRVAEDRM